MKSKFKLVAIFLYSIFSFLLLVYLLLPGPTSIDDFPILPDSEISTLPGDTYQVPNIKGFFSDNYRDFVIPFFFKSYQKESQLPFKPLRLNYPPEFAYTAIKDQTRSTYLEEITYPMRDSLFVNGMEPFDKQGDPRFDGATKFRQNEEHLTKVIIRFYPSSMPIRVLVWLGINLSFILLWFSYKKVILNA